jgi:hypothetical protein
MIDTHGAFDIQSVFQGLVMILLLFLSAAGITEASHTAIINAKASRDARWASANCHPVYIHKIRFHNRSSTGALRSRMLQALSCTWSHVTTLHAIALPRRIGNLLIFPAGPIIHLNH